MSLLIVNGNIIQEITKDKEWNTRLENAKTDEEKAKIVIEYLQTKGRGEISKYPIYANAFEAGILTKLIWYSEQKEELKGILEQLIRLADEIRKQAGVKVQYLGKGVIRTIDQNGNAFVRKMYPWEIEGDQATKDEKDV